MTSIASQCLFCAHFKEDYTCEAFPEEIPEKVLLNKKDHRLEIKGDNGIRWRPSEIGTVHPLGPIPT